MKKKNVEITDISYTGSGVGRVDGKVIFVPKALDGEEVEVKIVRDSKTFSNGQILKVLKNSADRVEPVCPYYAICGGCDLQHCTYEKEVKIKKHILAREMSKVGFDGDIDFVECEKRYGYRNKIKLEVEDGKVGYFRANSKSFFAIDSCPIADPEIQKNIKNVQKIISENNFHGLKNIYFKIIENKLAICFLFDNSERKNNYIIKNFIKNNKFLNNFLIYFAFGDILELNETNVIKVCGKDELEMTIDGDKIPVSVSGFNQVNDLTAEKLYQYLISLCKDLRVINAYSGQGLLTYLISKQAKFVYGIEFLISSHNAAEKLCEKVLEYKIKNVCGRVEDEIGKIVLRDRIDMVLLDPSRDGCKPKVLQAILGSKIERVVYVSCNFAILVRDLKTLKQNYQIESVKIFDMFPCSAKMESVVVLKRS